MAFNSKKSAQPSSRYSKQTGEDIDEDLVYQQDHSLVHLIDEELLEYSSSKQEGQISC